MDWFGEADQAVLLRVTSMPPEIGRFMEAEETRLKSLPWYRFPEARAESARRQRRRMRRWMRERSRS